VHRQRGAEDHRDTWSGSRMATSAALPPTR
jgi:hypothetical protein